MHIFFYKSINAVILWPYHRTHISHPFLCRIILDLILENNGDMFK